MMNKNFFVPVAAWPRGMTRARSLILILSRTFVRIWPRDLEGAAGFKPLIYCPRQVLFEDSMLNWNNMQFT